MQARRFRPTPAMVVALLALAMAIGGTAFAATKIGTKQLKNKAVTTKKIDNRAVKGNKIKSGSVKTGKIKDEAVKGSKIADDSIGSSKLSDLEVFGDSIVRATPTARPTLSEAQDAAPKVPLFSKGQLSIYGKCVTAEETPETFARVYAETSAAGSIFTGDEVDKLEGDPDYLDPGTPESDRVVGSASAGAGSFRAADLSRTPFIAMSPNGAAVQGLASMAVKRSSPSNGLYGPGVVCLFSGYGIG